MLRATIPLPSLNEQQTIADYLDTETARIDALIEKKRRMVELLNEKRRTLSTIVIRGDRNVPGVSPRGEVTKTRLRFILRERDTRGSVDEQVLSVYRELGVVPKAGREDNFNKTPEDLSLYKLVLPGDVVVNKMKAWQGSIAVSTHRGVVSGDYLVCSVVGDVHLPYLHHLLRSKPLIGKYASRSKGIRPSQWRLYWEDLADIAIVLPSKQAQQVIAAYLDVEVERLNGLVEHLEVQVELLQEHRQALTTAAVTGQIDIPRVAA